MPEMTRPGIYHNTATRVWQFDNSKLTKKNKDRRDDEIPVMSDGTVAKNVNS